MVVFATEEPSAIARFKKVPTFNTLPAVVEHRAIYLDKDLSGAAYFVTPLSLTYALDRLTPQLEDAAAGRAPSAWSTRPSSGSGRSCRGPRRARRCRRPARG